MKTLKKISIGFAVFILLVVSTIIGVLADSDDDPASGDDYTSQGVVAQAGFPVASYAYISAGSWCYSGASWCTPGGNDWHPGMDIATPTGTPTLAIGNGYLLSASWQGGKGYGNAVVYMTEVDGKVYTVIYGHLNSFSASVGNISAGQEIAKSGSTGNSTGPHVHVEIFYHHKKTPAQVIDEFYSQGLYYGLSYNDIGDCNDVCRLRPEIFFGVADQLGQ